MNDTRPEATAVVREAILATMDIDFVIDPTARQLDVLVSSLEEAGTFVSPGAAHDALSHRTMFNVIDPDTGEMA